MKQNESKTIGAEWKFVGVARDSSNAEDSDARVSEFIRNWMNTSKTGDSLSSDDCGPMELASITWCKEEQTYLDDEGYFCPIPQRRTALIGKIINAGKGNFIIMAAINGAEPVQLVIDGINLYRV